MRFGIWLKFIGIRQFPAVLPLGIGLATGWMLGYPDFKRERGTRYQSAAEHLALGLAESIQSRVETLYEFSLTACRWSRQAIRTGNELESLARDFLTMAMRVLDYPEQFEQEIRHKTAAIQRNLDIAREFQEALMPRRYPEAPSPPGSDALSLSFDHLYRPTSSVGGDFFDVTKLSNHRAGIFISDVMGHGARGAGDICLVCCEIQPAARR